MGLGFGCLGGRLLSEGDSREIEGDNGGCCEAELTTFNPPLLSSTSIATADASAGTESGGSGVMTE